MGKNIAKTGPFDHPALLPELKINARCFQMLCSTEACVDTWPASISTRRQDASQSFHDQSRQRGLAYWPQARGSGYRRPHTQVCRGVPHLHDRSWCKPREDQQHVEPYLKCAQSAIMSPASMVTSTRGTLRLPTSGCSSTSTPAV